MCFSLSTKLFNEGVILLAELVGRINWHRQEKTESVGEWKAGFMKSTMWRFTGGDSNMAGSGQVLPLELDKDDDGFLVVENPSFGFPSADQRRHSSINVPSVTTPPQRSVSTVAPPFLVWLS